MYFDLFVMTLALLIGNIFFGHFNTLFSPLRRLRKNVILLLAMAALSYFFGHWSLLFLVVILLGGGIYHWQWCLKYGIDPITSEPREKFESLVRAQYHLPAKNT